MNNNSPQKPIYIYIYKKNSTHLQRIMNDKLSSDIETVSQISYQFVGTWNKSRIDVHEKGRTIAAAAAAVVIAIVI